MSTVGLDKPNTTIYIPSMQSNQTESRQSMNPLETRWESVVDTVLDHHLGRGVSLDAAILIASVKHDVPRYRIIQELEAADREAQA